MGKDQLAGKLHHYSTASMAPKRATRSSTRAGQEASGGDEKKQLKLDANKGGEVKLAKEEDGDDEEVVPLSEDDAKPGEASKSGKKRTSSTRTDLKEGEVDEQDLKKDGQPATKKQKQEAVQKHGEEIWNEEELDDKSGQAKAKGREIQEDDNVDTLKPQRGTLEKGWIYFWYKPKVETEHPEGIDDVAKFHMLLLPNPHEETTQEGKTKYRLLTCGRKHLPFSVDEGSHEVEWGLVSAVGDDLKALKDALGSSTYETKTRGTRHQPASRCAGQGHYILHSPKSGKDIKPLEKVDENAPRDFPVYLAYSIAVPTKEEFGEVQRELGIQETGSFILQVKNPDAPSTNPRAAPGVGKDRAEGYPPELRGLFTTRFIPANPVKLLDYHGHELLFISGRNALPDDEEKKVIKEAEKESKELEEKEEKQGESEEQAIFEEVFEELHMFKSLKDVPGIRAL